MQAFRKMQASAPSLERALGHRLPPDTYVLGTTVAFAAGFAVYAFSHFGTTDPELSSAGFYSGDQEQHAVDAAEKYKWGPVRRFFQSQHKGKHTWGVFDNDASPHVNPSTGKESLEVAPPIKY